MELINSLEWRYATKKFDPSRKVSAEDLATIQHAVQLSVSSYGLQLYKVLVVEDPAIREKLKPATWEQTQTTDASHLFVFCNYTTVKPEHIDKYITLMATTRGMDEAQLKGGGDFVKSKMAELNEEEQFYWTKHQVYLALANLLTACATLRIDACPMEGFDPAAYNDILGLGDRGLNAAVLATIGYRSDEDQSQQFKKVRKPLETLFEKV